VLDSGNLVLAFGPFCLSPTERRLEREGRPVRLGGRALDLLIALVERAGETVPNQELLGAVWGDVNVEESSLRFHIKNLRKALGDRQYVVNVPGRGYCFAVPVDRMARASNPVPAGKARVGVRSNLPTRGASIVGRSDSIEAISRELSHRRLVTIVGPAGIGKTSLAVASAASQCANFGDAVRFVDLAPIEDSSLVINTLASILGLVLQEDDPLTAVVDFLGNDRSLLVLDNCEQVIEVVAQLAQRVLREATETHMLITSREPLRIAGEHVHRLAPLECPSVKRDVTASNARARASTASRLTTHRLRQYPKYAGASMAFHWRWNWPRLASSSLASSH
jgi:DNA-binding winged helix-turn-helix (wHTH) protein